MKIFRRLSFLVLCFITITSCDAPHLNALDPSSPNYNFGQLTGIVTGASSLALKDVRVIWKNLNIVTSTDSLGRYTFRDIKIQSGWLTFERNDYSKDSLYVNWLDQKSLIVDTKQLAKNMGTLDGFVYTNTIPGSAIPNTRVLWKNQNILTETNSSGYFKFDNLLISDGYISFERDGYSKDSIYIQWKGQLSVSIVQKLNFTQGKVSGIVKSLSGTPISGASVTLKGKNIVVKTNTSGYYEIENLTHQTDTLLFQAEGYSNVTLPLIWSGTGQDATVNASMNSNPKLTDLRIYSSIVNEYFSSSGTLYIQAKVTDEEVGDVDSVFVTCADLNNLRQQLQFNFATGFFEIYFQENSSFLSSIEDAIGKIFYILVKDKNGHTFNVGSSFVKRIIRDQITFFSPANGSSAPQNPTLKWKRFIPGYNFRYFVQVFTTGSVQQLVWQKDFISQDDVQVTVTANLIPGQNYYWVIWCIDDYQNRSRSKPATFVVQ